MREGHGARSRLAARRTSWWAGRHHHCPCCGSSGKWVPAPGLGCLDSPEPLPLALTGAVYDPACRLPLLELLPLNLICISFTLAMLTRCQRHHAAHGVENQLYLGDHVMSSLRALCVPSFVSKSNPVPMLSRIALPPSASHVLESSLSGWQHVSAKSCP